MKKIVEYLEQLGLSQIEAKIYLTLLESGVLTVIELASKIKINRTAAYPHITSLIEKGTLIELMKGSRKHLQAIEPERLHYLIDNQLDTITAIDKQFPTMVQTITASLNKNKQDAKVDAKYYKGILGLQTIYTQAFQAKELRCYANLNELDNIKWANEFRNDSLFEKALTHNKKLTIFEIIADAPETVVQFELDRTTQNGRYSYKFAPSNIGLSSGTLIFDNTVAIFNIQQEISGIVLQSTEYYHNSKKLFDFIWHMLPEPKF